MTIWGKLLDRTAVLFLGVAVGTAMGYAFGSAGDGGGDIGDAGAAGGRATISSSAAPASAPAPAPAAGPTGRKLANAAPPPGRPGPVMAADPRPDAASPQQDLSIPFSRQLLATVASGRKVRVGVFGDSYGDGIWAALYHLLPAKRNYEVVKFSQQSTGFTRYASLNLEDHVREQLAGGPVDVAVISFGANDTQGVMAGAHAARLLSPEWQRIVGQRVEGFVRILRDQGAMVYWVGLPRMRKPSYDADISGMNAFYAAKMRALGVPWIDTEPLSVDAQGQYAPYLPDGPKQERTLVRANDGIHMSMTGYVRITRGLAGRIEQYIAAARRRAGIQPPPPATASAPDGAARDS